MVETKKLFEVSFADVLKYRMLTSYHVHSKWSDGEGEIAEYIRAANELGLDEVGLSDHYVLTPSRRQPNWGMRLDGVDDYVEAVQAADGEAREGLVVRLGVEADFIPETIGEVKGILSTHPFDYVIGSVHIVDGFPIDGYPEDWAPLSLDEKNDVVRLYWTRVRQMADSGVYDIVGHADLTKKFGFRPTIDISAQVSAALDAIARSGMTVELNTSGWFMPVGEAYPEPSILRGSFQRHIPVIVTADAHNPANLSRGFDDAYQLIREIGFTQVASYAGRQRVLSPIDH